MAASSCRPRAAISSATRCSCCSRCRIPPSDCPWPAVAVRPAGLVGLTYQWFDPAGRPGGQPPFVSRLLADVPPHGRVDDTVIVVPEGSTAGTWRLEVLLGQQGVAEPLARASTAVELRPFAASR